MSRSQNQPRASRGQHVSIENLDDRQLLSAGMGSTFAIMPGTISTAGEVSTLKFTIDPNEFTAPRGGRITLGLDVAGDATSGVKAKIISIEKDGGEGQGRVESLRLQHSRYSQTLVKSKSLSSAVSTAVLTTVPVPKAGSEPVTYTVKVQGVGGTTGGYLLGFYLPGDSAGTGEITPDSVKTIRSKMGKTSISTDYAFDADANRDGKITPDDMRIVRQNVGAKVTISPIINVTLDPATDGPMKTRITNFRDVRFTGITSPNATIKFEEVTGNSAGATGKADATGNYSIMVPLGDGSNTFKVTSTDTFGQTISGSIAPVSYTPNPPTVINTPDDLK